MKVHDVFAKEIVTEVELAYYSLADAQHHYQMIGDKDGSILLSIKNENESGIDVTTELTVVDAEKIAFQILGLCAAVRNNQESSTL